MLKAVALVLALVVVAGCGASRSYRRGQQAANAQQFDEAVEYYRQALQGAPDKPEYKIALERAMQTAATFHVARGRAFEAEGRGDEALREYRKAMEYDPSNRSVAARAGELDRELRDRLEASRPRPAIEAMREQARRNSQEPVLNPTSKEPLNLRFSNTSLRDLLNFIGSSTGINVTYDRDFQDRSVTVQLEGVTLNEALQQVMLSNQIFYKVLNERTIIIATDNTAKRQQYEEQVIKTFFISHADAVELAQLVNTVILAPQMAIQPRIAPNKTANTLTVRAAAPVMEIIEQVIKINDKPRAEVIVDVQILEVSRERAKRFGLNLTDYALGGIFSPEQAPGGSSTSTGTGRAGGRVTARRAPASVTATWRTPNTNGLRPPSSGPRRPPSRESSETSTGGCGISVAAVRRAATVACGATVLPALMYCHTPTTAITPSRPPSTCFRRSADTRHRLEIGGEHDREVEGRRRVLPFRKHDRIDDHEILRRLEFVEELPHVAVTAHEFDGRLEAREIAATDRLGRGDAAREGDVVGAGELRHLELQQTAGFGDAFGQDVRVERRQFARGRIAAVSGGGRGREFGRGGAGIRRGGGGARFRRRDGARHREDAEHQRQHVQPQQHGERPDPRAVLLEHAAGE